MTRTTRDRRLIATAARLTASAWYLAVLAVVRVFGPPRASARQRSGRAVVVGTFHNPGWYRSHIVPLAASGLCEVIVVTHGALPQVDGVTLRTPPGWLTKVSGRTVSKLIWTIVVGKRSDADLFIGYHVIPNATIALVAARVLGRAACYQMTGGPIELIGGGYQATENGVVGHLGRPSARLERLAFAAAGAFDQKGQQRIARGGSELVDREGGENRGASFGKPERREIAAPHGSRHAEGAIRVRRLGDGPRVAIDGEDARRRVEGACPRRARCSSAAAKIDERIHRTSCAGKLAGNVLDQQVMQRGIEERERRALARAVERRPFGEFLPSLDIC